jgi:hypothetical protein
MKMLWPWRDPQITEDVVCAGSSPTSGFGMNPLAATALRTVAHAASV